MLNSICGSLLAMGDVNADVFQKVGAVNIGGYLSCRHSGDWALSLQTNVTVDFWIKMNTHVGGDVAIAQYEDSNNNWYIIHEHGSGWVFILESGGVNIITTGYGGEITDSNLHHIALCKVGNAYGMYVDGTQVNYVSSASSDSLLGPLFIGQYGDGSNFIDGYIDDIRISFSNVFSATPNSGPSDTISVPTSRPTPDSNTKLFITAEKGRNFGNTFYDTSDGNHQVFGYGALIDTSVAKFGNGMIRFDGQATDTISISGLDGDSYEEMIIKLKLCSDDGTGLSFHCAFNNDFVTVQYGYQITKAQNTTVSSSRATTLTKVPCANLTSPQRAYTIMKVHTKSGLGRVMDCFVVDQVAGTTIGFIDQFTVNLNNLVANITTLDFNHTPAGSGIGYGVGTSVEVYAKRRKV